MLRLVLACVVVRVVKRVFGASTLWDTHVAMMVACVLSECVCVCVGRVIIPRGVHQLIEFRTRTLEQSLTRVV